MRASPTHVGRRAVIIIDYDVAEPEPECGHYAYLSLHPWDPEVERLGKIADRRRIPLQSLCKVCRRWVRFDAWPPYLGGLAERYGAKIPAIRRRAVA